MVTVSFFTGRLVRHNADAQHAPNAITIFQDAANEACQDCCSGGTVYWFTCMAR